MSQGLDPGAVPGASTKTLLRRKSFYGGEIGSTDLLRAKEITSKERLNAPSGAVLCPNF